MISSKTDFAGSLFIYYWDQLYGLGQTECRESKEIKFNNISDLN